MKTLFLYLLSASLLFGAYVRNDTLQTVYDSTTGLTWQDNSDVATQTMNLVSANAYCDNLTFGGVSNWRLPNYNELNSIIVLNRIPSIDTTFQNINPALYWTSSTNADGSSGTWVFNFYYGIHDIGVNSYPYYVRCVSGGTVASSSLSSSSSSVSNSNSSNSSSTSSTSNSSLISSSSSSTFSFSSSSISSSSNSSSSELQPVLYTSKELPLKTGWNLITVPMQTETEFNLNLLLSGKATIAYKFNTDSYTWDRWLDGTANITLKNGEGVFVGVPSGTPILTFEALTSANTVRFENTSYQNKKWYLLGFGYDITVSSIKTLYPNSVVWIMENGNYKKLTDNATIIPAGQGFWFKNNQ